MVFKSKNPIHTYSRWACCWQYLQIITHLTISEHPGEAAITITHIKQM